MNSSAPCDSQQPLVSVVVTTKNEAKNIENCLKSIRLQTYPTIEIIVVDNYSTDDTCLLAKPYADQVVQKGPERSAQRNYGMMELAQGQYVMYVDADMILSPGLIDACVQYMLNAEYAALHISETILGTSYLSRVRRFERDFYDGTPIDGARFFDRKVFCDIGGFDEKLFEVGSGEDWDIDKKIKQVSSIGLLPRYDDQLNQNNWQMKEFIAQKGVSFEPNYRGIYHNESEFDLKVYIKKKTYYIKGFDGYIKKWGKTDPDICRQFGLKYRYWTVFVEQGKWKRLFMQLDKTFGMYFLRITIGCLFFFRHGFKKSV